MNNDIAMKFGASHAATAETAHWTPAHVAAIGQAPLPALPLIDHAHLGQRLPGLDIWDMWPLRLVSGEIAVFGARSIWFALSAPVMDDPELRHGKARIRLLIREDDKWTDQGPALPDGWSPGSREWSGSAVLGAEGVLTLYFTVAGRRGEQQETVEQRVFEATADIVDDGDGLRVNGWRDLKEIIRSDNAHYVLVDQVAGRPGFIKAFRDPEFFRDPADRSDYIVFCASLKQASSDFNGAIGIAQRVLGNWRLLPPLLAADGVNNELERPHILFEQGSYYLFWSTQQKTFDPRIAPGPTGLYGMVAHSVRGPYRPLNGTGLVAANPVEEPRQAYSWLVLKSLDVVSFVDHWGLKGRSLELEPHLAREQFGGAPAPTFKLKLEGDRAEIVSAE
jgi:levansucrase